MPSADERGRRDSWLAALLIGALVAWFAVALAMPLRNRPLPASEAAAFVPPDAFRYAAHLTAGRQAGPVMVESSRLSGGLIGFAMSSAALRAMDLPAEGLDAASWWREGVIPGDPRQPARYRVRSVGREGIFLRVQDWQNLGLSFERFLELPADVRAGQTWASRGRVLTNPVGTPLAYRNTSTATAPADPARAAQGCLAVSSRTEISSPSGTEPWRESSLWCPSEGAVESSGVLRGVSYAITRPSKDPARATTGALRHPVFDPVGLRTWAHRRERVVSGDGTFGVDEANLSPAGPAGVAANGLVVLPLAGTSDLAGLVPLEPGTLWAHWWARPGGEVVSTTTTGSMVLVSTTERRLQAYEAGGRLRWTVHLDDVAVAPPLQAGRDRLAVATVGGELTMIDGTDGRVVWRRPLPGGVHTALASNGTLVVAADTSRTLSAWDATTGRRVWRAESGAPFGSTLVLDATTLYSSGASFVIARDARTGAPRWRRFAGLRLEQIARAGDLLLVENAGSVEAWSPTDGSFRWSVPGAELSGAGEGGCLPPPDAAGPADQPAILLVGERLLAVTRDGRVEQEWPVSAPSTDLRTMHCAAGRIWLTAWAADGRHGLTIESVGPR